MKNSILDDIKKLKNSQYFLTLLILLFVASIAWISVSLIGSQQNTKITPKQKSLAAPLNPSLDTTVISSLEQKRTFRPQELESFPIYVLIESKNSTSPQPVLLGTQPSTQPAEDNPRNSPIRPNLEQPPRATESGSLFINESVITASDEATLFDAQ